MKALIVTSFRHFPGGVEKVNELLANTLLAMGYEVKWLCADGPHSFTEKILLKFLGTAGVTAWRWKNTFVSNDYALVIANGEHGLGINHPKALNYFHGSYLGLRGKRSFFNKSYWTLTYLAWIQKRASQNKKVLSVSLFLNSILNDQGIKVWKVFSPAIDCQLFKPSSINKKNELLFVGSGAYFNKGWDILEALQSQGKKLTCISNQNPNSSLEVLTAIASSEMPSWYNQFKYFIFPSRFESLGLAPLEAMACGLPVLMFDVGVGVHLKTIIPEFVLSLKDQDDSKYFLEGLKKIEMDYERLSHKAREYVLTYFSPEHFTQEFKSIIQEMNNA